ncbi:Pycsar system effector family protein [Streptomyces sp. NRRL F-5755]|uniref:Pycsar system effector family protein n=1 Tax=Streptomyces sp. NRRL F-5755 TaxID=1519475 RepID=UPI0006AE7357|nr:Pycsar system effector family protein [Streptomyces sp. NRRL F-5755]
MVGSGGDEGTESGARLARILLSETREEMLKADHKANVVLTVLGMALTALVGAVGAGGVRPLAYAASAQSLFWAGCAAVAPSFLLLGLAIVPRTGIGRRDRTHYFGDVASGISVRQLKTRVQQTNAEERDVHQFAVLSVLVTVKYRCIRRAMIWVGVFLFLTTGGILLGNSLR